MTHTVDPPEPAEVPAPRHKRGTLTVDRPPGDGDGGVLGLLALIALVVGLGFAFGFSWVVVIVTLVAIIFMHELGHYLTARSAGMKVTEFFLFFGPRIWSFRRGETEYGIKTVPLGAYVKIPGMTNLEDVPPEDEARTYRQQPYWRRMSVAVAGSAMHFVMAIIALFVFLGLYGDLVPRDDGWSIREVTEDSAALRAGLQEGDVLLTVAGQDATDFDQLGDLLEPYAGESVTIVYERDGERLETTTVIGERLTDVGADSIDGLLPGDIVLAVEDTRVYTYDELIAAVGDRVGQPVEMTYNGIGSEDPVTTAVVVEEVLPGGAAARGFLGVSSAPLTDNYSWFEAAPAAVVQFADFAGQTTVGIIEFFSPANLGNFISGAFESSDQSELLTAETTPRDEARIATLETGADLDEPRILSPYGLVRFGNDSAESGFEGWLAFVIVVNISVGVVNMIPLLPFDGGHVAIATYEKIRSLRSGRRYRVDANNLVYVAYAVLLLFLVVTVVALFRDIVDPIV